MIALPVLGKLALSGLPWKILLPAAGALAVVGGVGLWAWNTRADIAEKEAEAVRLERVRVVQQAQLVDAKRAAAALSDEIEEARRRAAGAERVRNQIRLVEVERCADDQVPQILLDARRPGGPPGGL